MCPRGRGRRKEKRQGRERLKRGFSLAFPSAFGFIIALKKWE
jgi:hypothetical protein